MKTFSREELKGIARFVWHDKLIVFTLVTFLLFLPGLAVILHFR